MSELATSKHALRLFHKLCSNKAHNCHGISGSYAGLQVLVVSNTLLYRHLAMTRVSEDDQAVEIGCSYGHCTALFKCPALGVDHAPEKVEEARGAYPHCRFASGDVFGDDLSWLDRDATVLFLDIGGGRNYKPVMKALAICIPHMPALRFVVAKSIEVRTFLLRFEDAVHTVARDLSVSKDDDKEAAEELAIEIRHRGGEVPVHLITLLRCGHWLRYLVGKQRIHSFVRGQAPLLQLVEANYGPKEQRLRIRAAPGKMTPPPPLVLSAAHRELAENLQRQMRGEEWNFLAVFSRLQRSLFKRFLAIASNAELYRQASDHKLDDRCLEPWSDAWQNSVALRHLHAFFVSAPEFAVIGDFVGSVPTIEEFRGLRVRCTGESSEAGVAAVTKLDTVDGQRVVLQVLDCNWSEGEQDVPEVQDLIVERAWLLVGGQVVERLTAAAHKPHGKAPSQFLRAQDVESGEVAVGSHPP